jgi:hypothetical protein
MVLLASDFDQSKYLKAADIGPVGTEKRLKIKAATRETGVGERKETKGCIWFTTTNKGLLLNKTNLRTLRDAFGNPMDPWVGRVIVAYVVMTDKGDGVRVRIPPPKDGYRAPAAPVELKQTAPVKKASSAASVDEDVDDFEDEPELNDDISDVK